jgi:hypothetical protein
MRIEPAAPTYQLAETMQGLTASIPARRNWFVLLFMCAWLGGWVLGEVSAITRISNPTGDGPKEFLAVWLIGWTLGGGWVLACVVWQLFGREVITIAAGELIYRVEALGLGRSRSFTSYQISRVRVVDFSSMPFSRQWNMVPPLFGAGYGPIAFDYGARTYRLGSSLDEAGARQLLIRLAPRLPSGASLEGA